MGRTALELIGQGGLGYSFDPLVHTVSNPFAEAVKNLVYVDQFSVRCVYSPFHHSPSFSILVFFRPLIPFVEWFGTPAFRGWLVDRLAFGRLRAIKGISDTIHTQATNIYHDKKAALQAGDEALLHKVGEGKDIMSILRKSMHIRHSKSA